MKKLSYLFIFFFCVQTVCADIISEYSEARLLDFMNLHMQITAEKTNASALACISKFKEETDAVLKNYAVDFEQEQAIYETFYVMEEYHYLDIPYKENKDYRSRLKAQMKLNESIIKNREETSENSVSKWMYLCTGDIMSAYMTRSVPATLHYGFKVKKFYERALEISPTFTNANVNIGNWLYYAPRIAGGGMSKAEKRYKFALDGARNNGERYYALLHLSQYYYSNGNKNDAQKYLDEASNLISDGKEVAIIKKLNQNGMHLFQYYRNQAGIDEKMKESDMDEDDKD